MRDNHPLKGILDEEGLRYVSLAARLGIRRDRLHHYLTGRRRMPAWVLVKIAEFVPHRAGQIRALGTDTAATEDLAA